MAVRENHSPAHHHRMIEHHARKLREIAAKAHLTKKTEAKGGRDAAREERRGKRGEFSGKRR